VSGGWLDAAQSHRDFPCVPYGQETGVPEWVSIYSILRPTQESVCSLGGPSTATVEKMGRMLPLCSHRLSTETIWKRCGRRRRHAASKRIKTATTTAWPMNVSDCWKPFVRERRGHNDPRE